MTRFEMFKKEMETLTSQKTTIVKMFGEAAVPVELERAIIKTKEELSQLEAEENRKTNFLNYITELIINTGLHQINDTEFRFSECYNSEIDVYAEHVEKFRVKSVTVDDYTVGEISVMYSTEAASRERVLFKISEKTYAFNEKAYDVMLQFVRKEAPEDLRFVREAEYVYAARKIRESLNKKGLEEVAWTPAASELNLG